ncbi:hypothetical protein BSKO_02039 [Bryopsis sp. KO-2023]|nr:hypothetical protein BSKO_02039 [Bryopsis sp. KO-2023]
MAMEVHVLVVTLLCALVGRSRAEFLVEKGGLKVQFPSENRATYDMALANFGQPKYGGRLTGKVVYVRQGYMETDVECRPSCHYACEAFSDAKPKYELDASSGTHIMLVDRGPYDEGVKACTFVQKVWNAQNAGAVGVVVVNHKDELLTPDSPNDENSPEFIKNITIPAGFVSSSVGDILKGLLKSHESLFVAMDWVDALPKMQQVRWEFWTNNNDNCGNNCELQREFIKDFLPFSRILEEGNYTRFSPHYLQWRCPDELAESEECESQCIHKGRYCSPDPEDDLDKGYDGKDVMMENLRQMCLYHVAIHSRKPWMWWEYAAKFWDECGVTKKQYGLACSEKVFMEINGPALMDGNGLDLWRECIDEQNMDQDINIPMLDEEMEAQNGDDRLGSVSIVPTIRINGKQYRGILKASSVMRAICSGFPLGEEPDVCIKEWVSENECQDGEIGHMTCSNSTNTKDGRTSCKNTFAGFECVCGEGYLQVVKDDGSLECMDINECSSADLMEKYEDCRCERCACHNTKGSFHCEYSIKNECETNNGGCWEDVIDGRHYTACVDTITKYKELAAASQADAETSLHECKCPPCFMENAFGECEALCDLKECESAGNNCAMNLLERSRSKTSTGGISVGGLIGVLLSVLVVVSVLVFLGYRRLRGQMHSELDYIMTHYMPLNDEKQEEANIGAANVRQTNDEII